MDRIERYKIEDLKNIPSKKIFTNFGQGDVDLVELHVYGGNELLESDYDVDGFLIDNYIKKGRKRKRPRIELDIHNDIRQLGFKSGVYKVHYNFFRDVLGSYNENNGLHIAEISPSRTEIKIKTTSQDENFIKRFDELQEKNVDSFVDEGWHDLLANFGENNVHLIVNWKDDGDDGILIKLYNPLPDSIQVKQQLWIVKEIITSHTEMIKLIPAEVQKVGEEISGPNFTIDISKGIGDTDWETWDSILGTNATTKQKLLNKFVSNSGYESAKLNIDYYYYSNFVHFSSAKERLENFKYKLGLIEYYNGQIATIDSMTSESYYKDKNLSDYKIKKEGVLEGFDGYESYLYFGSSSYQPNTTGNGVFYERTWPKSNTVEPYTNREISDPIAIAWFASQSNVALDYDVHNPHNLENTIPFHIRESNDGKDNENYLLFVNMVSHHFDTLYNYVDASLQIHRRENPLYEGLSKDLVYNALASFGWESYQGFQFTDLWEYAFAQNEDATYANSDKTWQLTGNATNSYDIFGAQYTVDSASVKYTLASPAQSSTLYSREDMSRETWKRMLNNLPYMLKTKGTERGIRALTTTYGLSPTLLRVFEYGGPQKDKVTDSYCIQDKFNFSLEFDDIDSNIKTTWPNLVDPHPYQTSPTYGRSPDSLEFRFNTWTPTSQSIYVLQKLGEAVQQLSIIPHPSSSVTSSGFYRYGKLLSVTSQSTGNTSGSSEWLPLFDNDWWSVMVTRQDEKNGGPTPFQGAQVLQFTVAKTPDHAKARITHTGSWNDELIKEKANWEGADTIQWGSSGSNNSLTAGTQVPFSGSLQEIRYWYIDTETQDYFDYWNPNHINHNATSSKPAPFWNHVKAPLSIEGINATSSFAQCMVRYSLGADLNRHSGSWQNQLTGGNCVMTSSAPAFWHIWSENNNDETNISGFPFAGSGISMLTNATASGFSGNLTTDWPTEEERHYTPMPDLIRTREISDKIRIEDSILKGRLSDRNKVERSQFDKAPLDSNRLGVYYAPHFEIDLDIAHELGGARFDNYVGNPLDTRVGEYRRLRQLRTYYWKKYTNPYNFFEYLRILKYIDGTLFKQVEHLIPARCNAQVGLLVKSNMLERPKVENLQEYVEENHYGGTLDISKYKITANTTTVGGEYHKWKNEKNGKWDFGDAVQSHTGYLSGSEQSAGEIEVIINTRKHHNQDLDVNGSRYYWDNLKWYKPTTGVWKHNPTASVIQGGASYENAGDFLLNISKIAADGYYGLEYLEAHHSTVAPISPLGSSFKSDDNSFDHPVYGHSQRSTQVAKFNDRGNIKYYHHQKKSRIYTTPSYHYFSPKNNMANSASTGNHPAPTVPMNGYSVFELANGFYRSGLRPVSKSYERSEAQDYRTHGYNNLLFAGCKLIGSDFNMPVLSTIDGGAVVEVTDTNANSLTIGTPMRSNGPIEAVNQNQYS